MILCNLFLEFFIHVLPKCVFEISSNNLNILGGVFMCVMIIQCRHIYISCGYSYTLIMSQTRCCQRRNVETRLLQRIGSLIWSFYVVYFMSCACVMMICVGVAVCRFHALRICRVRCAFQLWACLTSYYIFTSNCVHVSILCATI